MRIKTRIWVVISLMVFAFIIGNIWADEKDPLEQKISQIREEISLTNLINGLNLSEGQISEMIRILTEVRDMRKTYKEQETVIGEETFKSFDELKKVLENGPILPPDIEKRAGSSNEKIKGLSEEFEKKLVPFQQKIENVLTEAQKMVIDDFKPCLLPPKSQRNPVRVGQVKSNERAIELLRRLRDVPQNIYEQKKDKILQEYFNKFEEKKGKLSDEEKEKEKKRLFGLIDKVRIMPDDNFELEKNELADEFMIKDKTEELEKQLKEILQYRHKDGINKIGRFFLKPEMLSILMNRLNNLKNFKAPEPVNLDNIGNKSDSEKQKPSKNK
ncbi:MAG: hypothetical protein V1709_04435 [Planctomycetota bacterium]